MTVEQLLEKVRELQAREAQGEDVSSELAQVRQELEQHKAAAATPPAPTPPANPASATPLGDDERRELEQLRDARQKELERDMATGVAQQVLTAYEQNRQAQASRIQDIVGETLKAQLGGAPDVASAVEQVMKNTRGGSRFAGPNASPQVLDHLAAGGSVGPGGQLVPVGAPGLSGVSVGEHAGVKEIEESKNLARFCSIIARAKQMGPMGLTEGEQLFLRKQFMPLDAEGKAMAQGTPSAGGYLIPEQWMPDILTPLRAATVVRRANPRIVQFDKQMNQINMSSGAAAFYSAENALITPSQPTLSQAAILTPKYLTAMVPVSNVLLGNWARGDQVVRDDMTEAVGVREDLAFLSGDGTGGSPVGFRNIPTGIVNPLAPGANGFVPTMPQLRQLKGRTRLVGSPNPRWTWFFHPSILTYLETLTDTTGRFLNDTNILNINDDGVSGTFDGFPFYASFQIPVNLTMGTSTNVTYVLLVDMNEAIVGEEESLALAVSDQANYSMDGGTTWVSAFQQNQTVFRAIMGHDINHRRPATGIIVQEGVRTA